MPKVGIKGLRKQQLIDATLASIGEFGLQSTTIITISRIAGLSSGLKELDATERLHVIIEANFTPFQRSTPAIKTWLSFWAESMHDPKLRRLQHINSKRLYSNLLFSFRQLLAADEAQIAAKQTAAIIDGFWLRCALSTEPEIEFKQAEQLCKSFIDVKLTHQINESGDITCH